MNLDPIINSVRFAAFKWFVRRTVYWLVFLLGPTDDVLGQKLLDRSVTGNGSNDAMVGLRQEWAAKGVNLGSCELGVASADLDINNVRARLYNNGSLFSRLGPPSGTYTVPKSGTANALYAAGIWVGGKVEGELGFILSDYDNYELWPGPLDENGNPPADCLPYDRLYKVNRQDILDYNDSGNLAPDLRDWPAELGAPVIDGDGNPDNYDLAAGDRPEVLGDQTIWWVMNDLGNVHNRSGARPLGLEIQVTAFAFKTADALNTTTFYKYKIINKRGDRITDAYVSFFVDPDLGGAGDDYVGSDTTLGVGYVWNGDNFDRDYLDRPPALGVDFFKGPLVDADGVDNNADGEVDEEGESLKMTNFVYYLLCFDRPVCDPTNAQEAYQYQQSIWRDGIPFTFGGNGRGFSEERAAFVYPGNPPDFWSEENNDGQGGKNGPGDRRFLMSAGPFTMEPRSAQTITLGIVWSQGTDRFDSVRKMKADDLLAQTAFDIDFQLPPRPDPPRVEVAELDETVILKWGYRPSDNNYLDQYEAENLLLRDFEYDDKTYNFEGYNVLQFESDADETGKILATFDVSNSITRVLDVAAVDDVTGEDILAVSANGTDSGLQHSFQIDGLDNYRDYYFGVQAYGHNRYSNPKIIKSAVNRVVVRPSKQLARQGGTTVNRDAFGAAFTIENANVTKVGRGSGTVEASVIDPSVLTGHTYRVEFFQDDLSSDPNEPVPATNYNVIDATTGEIRFDGSVTVASFGNVAPQGEDVFELDGLSWTIKGPNPGPYPIIEGSEFWAFVQVEGIGNDDACGPDAGSRFGCGQVGGNWVYGSPNGAGDWLMHYRGPEGPEASIGGHAPNDFELRATTEGSYAYGLFDLGEIIWVPFELWDVGIVGPFGTNDPSDDVQMIPVVVFDNGPGRGGTGSPCTFGFNADNLDPFDRGWYGTDRIYSYYPVGGATYEDWKTLAEPLAEAGGPDGCPVSPETDDAADVIDFSGRPLQRLVFYMDPDSPNFRSAFIPEGNIIRFLTTKPNLPGDVFTVNTEGYGVEHQNTEALKEALDLIAVVPNPYKGVSDYEVSELVDVVRFTNMPEEATIRIFTLAGTLVKTIYKNSASTSIEWDLRTDENLPIGSGMYLIHVEVPGVGDRVIKFGAIKKRAQFPFY